MIPEDAPLPDEAEAIQRANASLAANGLVPFDAIATTDDINAHDTAMREYLAGEVVRHEDINWE